MDELRITIPAPTKEIPDGVRVLKNGAWADKRTGKIVRAPAKQLWDSKKASEMAKKRHAAYTWQDALALKTAKIILKEVEKQSDKLKKPLNKMRRGVEGDCVICGVPFELVGRMFMDHDHITGKKRGYVCPGCNSKLAWFDAYADKIVAHIKRGMATPNSTAVKE